MSGRSEAIKNKDRKRKQYYFQEEWEEQFFFTKFKNRCLCLICGSTITMAKKCNIERHFTTQHKKYEIEYPFNTNLRHVKVKEMKSNLNERQSVFTKVLNKSKSATIASFKVARILAMKKKPFEDGEMIKKAMIEVSDTLFGDFKNKSNILSAIEELQLSRNTVTRRIEAMSVNVRNQLKEDFKICEFFSLQCDESTDISNTAQLNIFIRMVFKDSSVKEDILSVIPLKGRTRGSDIYQAVKSYLNEINLPVKEKLVSITTDGAPAMIGSTIGFISLCKQDPEFPAFFNYHCIIHQQALCGKVINFEHVMSVVLKIVNSIRARPLQHRLFKILTDEVDAQYGSLVLHSEVRWLSKGKVLERFQNLLPHIIQFLKSKNETYEELTEYNWLCDLAFLTDLTLKLNDLNLELQGKYKNIFELIGSVNSFKLKLILWISQFKNKNFSHFTSVEKRAKEFKQKDMTTYSEYLEKIKQNFDNRFLDFKKIEPIASFILNPFCSTDISEVSAQIAGAINNKNINIEMEIINLQSNLVLKARSLEPDFWSYVEKAKYPLLKETYHRMIACFGSTYLCESAFSTLKILKSKYRSRLSDLHLNDCIRMAVSAYIPEYDKLAEDMKCQTSH